MLTLYDHNMKVDEEYDKKSIIRYEFYQSKHEIARLYITTINNYHLNDKFEIINVFKGYLITKYQHNNGNIEYVFGNLINNDYNLFTNRYNYILNNKVIEAHLYKTMWQNPISGNIENPLRQSININNNEIISKSIIKMWTIPQYITFKPLDNKTINVIGQINNIHGKDSIKSIIINNIDDFKTMLININNRLYDIISYSNNIFIIKYLPSYINKDIVINDKNFLNIIFNIKQYLSHNLQDIQEQLDILKYHLNNMNIELLQNIYLELQEQKEQINENIYTNSNNDNIDNNYSNNIDNLRIKKYLYQDNDIISIDKNFILSNIDKNSLIENIINCVILYLNTINKSIYQVNNITININNYIKNLNLNDINNNHTNIIYVNDLSHEIICDYINDLYINMKEILTIYLNLKLNIFDTIDNKIITKITHNFIKKTTIIEMHFTDIKI